MSIMIKIRLNSLSGNIKTATVLRLVNLLQSISSSFLLGEGIEDRVKVSRHYPNMEKIVVTASNRLAWLAVVYWSDSNPVPPILQVVALVHDFVRRATSFVSKIFCICTLCRRVFFSSLLPWKFIFAKLRYLTISKRGLVVMICLSDVNMHKAKVTVLPT